MNEGLGVPAKMPLPTELQNSFGNGGGGHIKEDFQQLRFSSIAILTNTLTGLKIFPYMFVLRFLLPIPIVGIISSFSKIKTLNF